MVEKKTHRIHWERVRIELSTWIMSVTRLLVQVPFHIVRISALFFFFSYFSKETQFRFCNIIGQNFYFIFEHHIFGQIRSSNRCTKIVLTSFNIWCIEITRILSSFRKMILERQRKSGRHEWVCNIMSKKLKEKNSLGTVLE